MSIEIKLATTEEEKEAIYKLRYQVYAEEMGVPLHADHEKKMAYDVLDDDGHTFYVEKNNKIIGTGRINFGKESPLELVEEYDMERFGGYFPNNVSTTTRYIIHPNYRKSTVASRLINKLYTYAIEHNSEFDFININKSKYQLYRRMGYREYTKNFHREVCGECIPLVLVLNDADYLEHIRSPFARLVSINSEKQKQINEFLNKNQIRLKE